MSKSVESLVNDIIERKRKKYQDELDALEYALNEIRRIIKDQAFYTSKHQMRVYKKTRARINKQIKNVKIQLDLLS